VEAGWTEIPSQSYNYISKRLELGKVVVAAAVEICDPREPMKSCSGRTGVDTIPDTSASSVEAFVRARVRPGAMLLTDGHRSYRGLTEYRFAPPRSQDSLPHTQRVFQSLKDWFAKANPLTRAVIDAGRNHFLAQENRHADRQRTFDALLTRAIQHEPISYRNVIRGGNF
jgi:hypothetical protein